MKKSYAGYVISENEQPNLINEDMEFDSLDEYVNTIVKLIRDCQETDDHESEDIVVQKLLAHDFELETDPEDEDGYYVHVLVKV